MVLFHVNFDKQSETVSLERFCELATAKCILQSKNGANMLCFHHFNFDVWRHIRNNPTFRVLRSWGAFTILNQTRASHQCRVHFFNNSISKSVRT